MKFDDILNTLGEFGRYQRLIYVIVCVIVFTNPWLSVITVFLNASVDHWCAVEEWNPYNCSEDGLPSEQCEQAKKVASIPRSGEQVFEQCEKYNVSGVVFWPGLDPSNYSSGEPQTTDCDQGWVYDNSQYKSTTVSDFDLVCGKEDLAHVSQTVFYGGYLAGSLIFGFLSDVIGRWWTLMLCMVLRLVAGTLLAFAPEWWVFTLLRFFQGMASIATYIILFVIGTEYVGPTKRTIAGNMVFIAFSVGHMFLALLAYWIRYWRTLQLVVTAPVLAFIGLMFFLPESARWLVSVEKYDKAEKIVMKIAEVNKRPAPDPIFSEDFKKEQKAIREAYKPTAVDLFRTRSVCLRTIALVFIWMVNAMVYHGLSLNSSNFGVDDYISFAISGAVEIPAYLLTIFTVEFFGRKPTLSVLLLVGGVACLSTIGISPGVGLTAVAMLGKFGISGSFAVTYLYTAELYPTEIRAIAVGTCSMFSRVANMVAPLILTLTKYWAPLPLVVFGSCTVLAGFVTLILPETRGMKLPETRLEGEHLGRKMCDDGNNDHGECEKGVELSNHVNGLPSNDNQAFSME